MTKRNSVRVPCGFNHNICHKIDKSGGAQAGASALIVTIINGDYYCLLGYEKYRDGYVLCAGRRNQGESCYLQVINRELEEEFKMDIREYGGLVQNNKHFYTNKNINYIIVTKSPTFIGLFKHNEIDIDKLNEKVKDDNNNTNLDRCYREMSELRWIRMDNIKITIKKNEKGKNKMVLEGYDINGNGHKIITYTFDIISKALKKLTKTRK